MDLSYVGLKSNMAKFISPLDIIFQNGSLKFIFISKMLHYALTTNIFWRQNVFQASLVPNKPRHSEILTKRQTVIVILIRILLIVAISLLFWFMYSDALPKLYIMY